LLHHGVLLTEEAIACFRVVLEPAPRERRQGSTRPAKGASGGGHQRSNLTTTRASETLQEFADTVNALALAANKGTWMGDKGYVAQVWRDWKPERRAGKPSLDDFKERLVAAARAGLVLLSRADLVGAYPPEALKESLIEVGGEAYHFIETQHL